MKKLLAIIFTFLVSSCFVFAGCSGKATVSMPQDYSNIKSNGGFVVGVGDYLYFANAYQSYSSLIDGDNQGKVERYYINRVQTLANGDLVKEEENVKYEKFADKIAGYETSNMFVVGSYLYFTSPNIHKEQKTGNTDVLPDFLMHF